jgi:hypothetical protein
MSVATGTLSRSPFTEQFSSQATDLLFALWGSIVQSLPSEQAISQARTTVELMADTPKISARAEISMTQKLFGLLEDLKQLESGWDDDDAEPISPQAIQSAERWLNECQAKDIPLDFIAPLRDGGLQLEWKDLSRQIFLEIEISPTGQSRYLIHSLKSPGLIAKESITDSLDALRAKLSEF